MLNFGQFCLFRSFYDNYRKDMMRQQLLIWNMAGRLPVYKQISQIIITKSDLTFTKGSRLIVVIYIFFKLFLFQTI